MQSRSQLVGVLRSTYIVPCFLPRFILWLVFARTSTDNFAKQTRSPFPMLLSYTTLALAFARLVLSSKICLDGKTPLCSDGTQPLCQDELVTVSSGCPKACDPHNNRCDATAPTCIFPDPRVASPRGACACRPGYKAANSVSNGISKQWRLPVEGHEHRVWVAEDVKCDTLCDVSTGANACLEVSLIGKECVGGVRNASYQSEPVFEGGSGNYSRSLSTATIESATGYPDELTRATGVATDDIDDFEAAPDTASFDISSETDLPIEGASSIATEHSSPSMTSPGELENLDAAAVELPSSFVVAAMSPEGSENPTDPDSDLDDLDETTPSSSSASPSSTELPTLELDDVPTTREDLPLPEFLSTPSLEARLAQETTASKNYWAKIAQQQGLDFLVKTWSVQISGLTQAVKGVDMAQQPRLCPAITGSVTDSCKKGVRTQVAYCKRSLQDKIAKCKNDVERSVDECKNKAKSSGQKAVCEASRAPGLLKCGSKHVKIPSCELDRLTASCCEGLRKQASSMCRNELTVMEIQNQVHSARAMCSVATNLAETVMKSYLSGQTLGLITQLESVKAIGDGVQVLREIEKGRSQIDKWIASLEAAAEGRMQDAQKALGSLASQITPSISNPAAWRNAVQAAIAKKVDEFVTKAFKAAGEIEAIQSARRSIKALKDVVNDINAIRTAAVKCATVPKAIWPSEYSGWRQVKSETDVEAAVEAYERKVAKPLRAAAECQAVVIRVQRLLQ
jgi:hypothetical protein